LAGIFLGWHLAQLFPDQERLVEVIGIGWVYLMTALQSLGGLAAVGSFALIVFQIYRWSVERKDKKK
jgi:hypothetical protein